MAIWMAPAPCNIASLAAPENGSLATICAPNSDAEVPHDTTCGLSGDTSFLLTGTLVHCILGQLSGGVSCPKKGSCAESDCGEGWMLMTNLSCCENVFCTQAECCIEAPCGNQTLQAPAKGNLGNCFKRAVRQWYVAAWLLLQFPKRSGLHLDDAVTAAHVRDRHLHFVYQCLREGRACQSGIAALQDDAVAAAWRGGRRSSRLM